MSFMESIRTCLSKYVDFTGRAARSEFWFFALFTTLGSIVLGIVDTVIFGAGNDFSPLSSIFSLAVLLPSLAVAARRLHDIDRTAWWLLLVLVPIVGWLVLLYFHVLKGTDGPNRFGNDPLGGAGHGGMDDGDYAASSIPRSGS
ncbi:DUF805 domain-containing protein [Aliiroseovarius sp. 2305UL8-7]|uniref:DUF805 domain-containing protein n=1 Tax=Aliiroseovarius conchicola TaxID=3121637 RepID=UPI0035275B12